MTRTPQNSVAFRAEPSLPDLTQKDDLVDRFQQSWTTFTMDRNRSVHDASVRCMATGVRTMEMQTLSA